MNDSNAWFQETTSRAKALSDAYKTTLDRLWWANLMFVVVPAVLTTAAAIFAALPGQSSTLNLSWLCSIAACMYLLRQTWPRIHARSRLGQKWAPIHRVHSVGALHEHFARVMAEHMEQLQAMTNTDWTTIPKQLGDGVQVIEEFDQKSTFFRYPGAGDAYKADFKESSIAEIWSRMGPDDPPGKGVRRVQ